MYFNSYIFILLFLPITLAGYFYLNKLTKYEAAKYFLVASSLCFYGYFNVRGLAIFAGSLILNYFLSRILAQKKYASAKLVLAAALVINIGVLFIFKYYNFFVESVCKVIGAKSPLLNLILPLAISFYTFQQIAYLVDSYRGETKNIKLVEYLLLMSFFPQIMEGPIILHGQFVPQLRDEKRLYVNYDNLLNGLYGFSLGLAKKVLIADSLAGIVSAGYENISALGTLDALFVMLVYSLQLYFDFSGYCDMAFGISKMFNFDIPINFNSPYKAVSIADFWDRWHMTLTQFFTKYLYIPLGGSRKGKVRTYINILIIFFISGLWHGANWNFVVWGLMNGAAMVIYRLIRKFWDKLPKFFAIALTFIFDIFAWGMFRANNLVDGIFLYVRTLVGGVHRISNHIVAPFFNLFEIKIISRLDVINITEKIPELLPLIFIGILIAAVMTMKNTQEKMEAYKASTAKLIVTVGLLIWCIVSFSGVTTFLYNNF